ncbi:hypothetical protein Pmar_PMAR012433 [Perkinsus marinus ATCC 50983]|uniref:Uncharacterized protein n=1 Tax=Perkinsus marinus (strain ATCC 50983 / TXsc) TaxID=423536 RepID=C5K7B8_PERM5|nr:hypothetical protein Pmar_PMAR012433 [Perkinsus marinus ATCC 50983]EER19453.1 hypothetical protein Pmar_PMAR012433 [Perkinsus marinus ATCC 50983]|eukprot:XP_002787657.1 hypothetical protein Pmar_PMAR012433 [Perkinsus marinus ATCC 50983]
MVDALSSFCWLVPLKTLEARELLKAKFATMSRAEKREWSVHLAYVNRCVNLAPLDNGLTAFETFFQRPYSSILGRKVAAVNDLVVAKNMSLEDTKGRGQLKSFQVANYVRRCNPAVNDRVRYKVVRVYNRSVDLQRDDDLNANIDREHVRNIVAANEDDS